MDDVAEEFRMSTRSFFSALLVTVAAVAAGSSPRTASATSVEDSLARPASWRSPEPALVKAGLLAWLEAASAAGTVPAAAIERADAAWGAAGDGSRDLLDGVLDALAASASWAEAIRAGAPADGPEQVRALEDPAMPAIVRDAVRLWCARELVRQDRYDEALPILVGLDITTSADPATLLFLRGACQHWLLESDAAVESLDRLLEREAELPARYARVARLLRADAAALEADSLDLVARRMRDAGRRLAQGRAGAATRAVQDGVVSALDRMIKQLEDEQCEDAGQQAAAGGTGGSGAGKAGTPMDDSRIAGARGAGEARQREFAPGDSWGDLPPHDRDRALQQIGREFPPHYREAIEQYFKRLATDGDGP